MGIFNDLGRKVEEFKQEANRTAKEQADFACRECGERFHAERETCPECGGAVGRLAKSGSAESTDDETAQDRD